MSVHVCDAIVIACIDFRFQEHVDNWLKKTFKKYTFDRVGLAGGIFDFYTVLKHQEISNRLLQIKKVVLINHEDCGAYGKEGTVKRHEQDLIEAERKIEAIFPHLDVKTYYLTPKGEFREISRTRPHLK